MEYRILGPLAVQRDGHDLPLGGLRQRAVLAVLLLAEDRVVEVDRLIEQVWGDGAPAKPLASLRAYVANLRRILGADAVLTRSGPGYRLDTAADVVDVREFARLVAHGRKLLDVGDAATAMSCLDEALNHWRGTPLADFRSLDFAMPEVHRLDTMRADAVELRVAAALRVGVDADLIADVESELAVNPLRESLWAQLMLAMYRSGRRSDALRAYERVAAILDMELGVQPGVALQRLATDIRNESESLRWQPTAAPQGRPTSGSSGGLFGRSSEVRRLRAALSAAAERRGGMIVVTGESGIGKTALAHCAADVATDMGMAVAWAGHAFDIRRPPSWAWAHSLRELGAQLPSGAGALHAPLPDWWSVAADDANAGESPEATGFTAVEAVTAALAELVSKRPALIVLDDLQRADRFTHDVLEHIVSAGHRLPLLIVATWQDGTGSDRSAGSGALDHLRSRTDVDFVKLRGLGTEATADLIADVSSIPPRSEFTASVHAHTGGNPFYTRELVRLLIDDHRLEEATVAIDGDAVPEAVSGVIRTRLNALPAPSRAALYAGAVAGAEFLVARMAAVMECPMDEATDALLPAQNAGLIVEFSSAPAAFRFSHGLVRDAIAGEITGVQRARLHAAVARAYVVEFGDVASQDAIDGAHHAWHAGAELDTSTALHLLERARTDAWARSAYRDVAELDRRALDVCARLPEGPARFETEVDLQLQLASVEAVVSGQSSAKVLQELRRSSDTGTDAIQSTTSVAMGCLEACGTGRYHDAAVLSDSLVDFFGATADPIAGAAGYYIRALTDFMRGRLDSALEAVAALHSSVPAVDWEHYGALASFEVLAYGVAAHAHGLRGDGGHASAALAAGLSLAVGRRDAFGAAVLRTADVQLAAMTGVTDGMVERSGQVVAELTELGVDQFIGGARIIRGWAQAMGPDGVDTVDEMAAALELHAQGGRRIFTPLYLGLLCDATARHRNVEDALPLVARAESIATSTGEHVWDAQLSARRLGLAARRRGTRSTAY